MIILTNSQCASTQVPVCVVSSLFCANACQRCKVASLLIYCSITKAIMSGRVDVLCVRQPWVCMQVEAGSCDTVYDGKQALLLCAIERICCCLPCTREPFIVAILFSAVRQLSGNWVSLVRLWSSHDSGSKASQLPAPFMHQSARMDLTTVIRMTGCNVDHPLETPFFPEGCLEYSVRVCGFPVFGCVAGSHFVAICRNY